MRATRETCILLARITQPIGLVRQAKNNVFTSKQEALRPTAAVGGRFGLICFCLLFILIIRGDAAVYVDALASDALWVPPKIV
jgi:hypothetical protein